MNETDIAASLPYGSTEDRRIAAEAMVKGANGDMYPAVVGITADEIDVVGGMFDMFSDFLSPEGLKVMSALMHKITTQSHGRMVAEAMWRSSFPPYIPPPEFDTIAIAEEVPV